MLQDLVGGAERDVESRGTSSLIRAQYQVRSCGLRRSTKRAEASLRAPELELDVSRFCSRCRQCSSSESDQPCSPQRQINTCDFNLRLRRAYFARREVRDVPTPATSTCVGASRQASVLRRTETLEVPSQPAKIARSAFPSGQSTRGEAGSQRPATTTPDSRP